jgi:hypothetical protein
LPDCSIASTPEIPTWHLQIEDDLLVLTDADSVELMMKQMGEYRRVVTQQLQAVFTP